MLFDGIDWPVSYRLWWFQRMAYMRKVQPSWLRDQEEGIACLTADDCNNDKPCKYARSRGE